MEKWQVEAAVSLIDEEIPYPLFPVTVKSNRALNDEQLRNLFERLTYLRNLEDKKNRYFPVLRSRENSQKS